MDLATLSKQMESLKHQITERQAQVRQLPQAARAAGAAAAGATIGGGSLPNSAPASPRQDDPPPQQQQQPVEAERTETAQEKQQQGRESAKPSSPPSAPAANSKAQRPPGPQTAAPLLFPQLFPQPDVAQHAKQQQQAPKLPVKAPAAGVELPRALSLRTARRAVPALVAKVPPPALVPSAVSAVAVLRAGSASLPDPKPGSGAKAVQPRQVAPQQPTKQQQVLNKQRVLNKLQQQQSQQQATKQQQSVAHVSPAKQQQQQQSVVQAAALATKKRRWDDVAPGRMIPAPQLGERQAAAALGADPVGQLPGSSQQEVYLQVQQGMVQVQQSGGQPGAAQLQGLALQGGQLGGSSWAMLSDQHKLERLEVSGPLQLCPAHHSPAPNAGTAFQAFATPFAGLIAAPICWFMHTYKISHYM